MSSKIKYADAPEEVQQALQDAVAVSDFLPSPKELVMRSEKEKITIAIDKQSLELFRKYAKKHNTKYQTMINQVVGSYADKFLAH